MPKLVKLGTYSDDNWRIVSAEDAPESIDDIADYSLLPLSTYIHFGNELSDKQGVWLASDDDVNILSPHLANVPVIACNVTNFMDGRHFSQARILRDHMEYTGHIRAVGDYLQDQMFYLLRCGFSEFSVADDADLESLQISLNDFSDSYQAACDTHQPLFRRRA